MRWDLGHQHGQANPTVSRQLAGSNRYARANNARRQVRGVLGVRKRAYLEPHIVPGGLQTATARHPANHVFGRRDKMPRCFQKRRSL